MRTVWVDVDPRPYEVIVGSGAFVALEPLLAGRRRVAVVSQAPVAERHLQSLRDAVRESVADVDVVLIDDGEAAKVMTTVEGLCRRFADGGLLRGDVVIGLGGGVVGDVTGFAAAVYHRGIDVVHAPTTLLGMVDSAIGGKTGVNLPEGKNLVGAFHQPLGVVADVDTLATLPEREYRSGLGEVAKYALLGNAAIAAVIWDGHADIEERNPELLSELVVLCATAKAAVVASDPQERTGARASLNYGHTLAHALEIVTDRALSHGEAVAIGLVFAAELAHALDRLDVDEVDQHRALLEGLGLPVGAPAGAVGGNLLAAMRRDKKAQGGLTFVLRGAGGVELVHDPPAPAVERALRAVGVEGSLS